MEITVEHPMEITVGRSVLYTLSDDDAKQINRRRTSGGSIFDRIKRNTEAVTHWPLGAQAHIGNEVLAGQVFPLLVTKVWSPGMVNGQVLLDGTDCFWATSVIEGTGPRSWAWPTRN